MFSVILFVDGFPVHFLVHSVDNTFYFQPIGNPYKKKVSKKIQVAKTNSGWFISGTEDENLVDQIIEDLSTIKML